MDSAGDIRLLVAVATELEAAPFGSLFPDAGLGAGGLALRKGEPGGVSAGLLVTGIGMVNAALALSANLAVLNPEAVIFSGVGGGYPDSGISVRDVAVATSETYGELGVLTAEGWSPANVIGVPVLLRDGREYFNEFSIPDELVERARHAAAGSVESSGAQVAAGVFVTVSQVSGTRARGRELFARFGGVCENMEGAAAAHVCAALGVPFMEIRGISNLVEDRDRASWDLEGAAERAAHAVARLISQWLRPWGS